MTDPNDESVAMGQGSIFGPLLSEATEILDVLDAGVPYGPADGPTANAQAENIVATRRRKQAERAKMLLIERLFDERVETIDWFRTTVPPAIRLGVLDLIDPQRLRGQSFVPPHHIAATPEMIEDEAKANDTLAKVVSARVKEFAFDFTAELFRRAYEKDIQRGRAAVLIGAVDRSEWIWGQAREIVNSPFEYMHGIRYRLRAAREAYRTAFDPVPPDFEEPEP